MARKRALVDAASDPLTEKAATRKAEAPGIQRDPGVWLTLAVLGVGLVVGAVLGRWVKWKWP
jgi:hypothetical protein